MDPEWASAWELATAWGPLDMKLFSNPGLPQKPVTTEALKGKDAQTESTTLKQEMHLCVPLY